MVRRKVRLHVDGDDPWIDIRRSGSQGDPDDDWSVVIIGVIFFVILIAWLAS